MWIKMFLLTMIMAIAVSARPDPVDLIKAKDAELQSLLRKKNRNAKDTEKIKSLINDIFDFQNLGRRALPAATWKDLDSARQATFVAEFKRMVENSSVKKLEVYQADSTIYSPTEFRKDDEAKVEARAWQKGKDSFLVYRLQWTNGQWRAWDLIIDDLSTVRNYREQFTEILKTKSFDELLDIIRKNADETAK